MPDEEMESSEQEDGGIDAAQEQRWATENLALRAEARKNKQKDGGGISDAAEKAKQIADRMAKLQKAWRVFNATTGLISIADLGLTLFITWLSMNGQLIFGNGFKVKYVPPLALWEILILAIVDLIVALLAFFIFVIIVIIAKCGETYAWVVPTGKLECGWELLKSLK